MKGTDELRLAACVIRVVDYDCGGIALEVLILSGGTSKPANVLGAPSTSL